MERINLTKFGFVRSPQDDFSDDGSRFTCYRRPGVEKVRISKLVSGGYVYIAARYEDSRLPYEICAKLPHYAGLDRLNGVSQGVLTEDDLQRLYDDCFEFDKEYEEAVKTIKYPSKEELVAHARELQDANLRLLDDLNSKLTVDLLLDLPDYQLKSFKNYYSSLKAYAEADPERAEMLYGSAMSFNYLDRQPEGEWYYKQLCEIIAR